MDNLTYLAIILSGVFAAHYFAGKTRLTPLLFLLAFGSLMVNLGLLPVDSSEFIRGFSELGIILIMFALGLEEDASHFVKGMKRSWGIALFGAIAPFFTAYYAAMHFWHDSHLAIICGLAMTATAVSLTMVSLQTEKLESSETATGIMTSAVLDDIGTLALVAILIPIITGSAELSNIDILLVLLKAVAFFVIVTLLGIWLFPSPISQGLASKIPWLNRLGMKEVLSLNQGGMATLSVLLIALLISILAYYFGFHPAVGAYMAGLIIKREYFHFHDHPRTDYYQQTKNVIDNVAFSWIGPVFFVELGTRLVFEKGIFLSVLPETVILTVSIFLAQILSAAIAARYTGHFKWHESLMIGFGHLGRAELAFVIMDIGYVQYDLLTEEAFYTLMFSIFWLNISVPLTIKFWKPYYQGDKQLRIKFGSHETWLSRKK